MVCTATTNTITCGKSSSWINYYEIERHSESATGFAQILPSLIFTIICLSPKLRCGVKQQPKNRCCRKFCQILTVRRDLGSKELWLILRILLVPGIAQPGHQ